MLWSGACHSLKCLLTYWQSITLFPDYESIGCYKDTSNRAIPTLEGADAILDGSYPSRKSPIAKCAVAAMRKGYSMFAVQNGGWCAASATAPQTFDKYGKSSACRSDGEGGGGANQVYVIKGKPKYYQFQEVCRRFVQISLSRSLVSDEVCLISPTRYVRTPKAKKQSTVTQ